MKSIYLRQATGQAGEAINRLEDLLNYEVLKEAVNSRKPKRFDIMFEHVSFSYPGTGQEVIDNISFKLPQGQTYALAGASGSGRTTIARLPPRFWNVQEGRISIGGVGARDISKELLMDSIAFVFRQVHLFKTTLWGNLIYGKSNATKEKVNRAIDVAQCREIVDRLPDGLQTKIGAEGTYLSGGEQQRIVLVRAVLKDAPTVVLDEATAFADPENEVLIKHALKELTRGKTILKIAHRLSTAVDADRILAVDNGKIVEEGIHQELLAEKGIYAAMWNEYNRSASQTISREEDNNHD